MTPGPTPHPTAERKRQLRARARRIVAGLADAPALSGEVCHTILGADFFRRARAVMVYLPLPGEPDCTPLIAACLEAGRTVCAPEVDWAAGAITPVRLTRDAGGGLRLSAPGRHGVRSPERPEGGGGEVDPSAIDLVLVPGLAFDARGGRLGRGAGFYDRLLPRFRADATRCGVCFDAQIVEAVPMNEGDAPVDAVATERRLIRVGGAA